MSKHRILYLVLALLIAVPSCNMFYIAVRNVPVFFSSPEPVPNKIREPIKDSVRLSALWIGHATVLLQMDDKVIITDPVLTETVGELARRVYEPGIDVDNIPPCDIILISHSHFDHLNYSSLEMLEKKGKKSALVFPQGLEEYLPNYDFNYVRLRNNSGYKYGFMGESRDVNGVKVTAVFARHWGGRYGLDGYLWGETDYTGFVLEYHGLSVYFAGDTGYDSTAFKSLGNTFNIDIALIPIGPCADCKNCGTKTHIFPTDAIELFKDIKAKWMIPIHYGTFVYAQAEPELPLEALNEIVDKEKLNDKVNVLKIGEQKIYYTR